MNHMYIPWRSIATIAAVAGIGLAFGMAIAPPIAAVRPLPDPIIERVPIYTADVLDTGPACVYTWNQEVFVWTRAHLGIRATVKCPPAADAKRRWRESLTAPISVRTDDER